jgi:hypothetical protein
MRYVNLSNGILFAECIEFIKEFKFISLFFSFAKCFEHSLSTSRFHFMLLTLMLSVYNFKLFSDTIPQVK